MNKAQIREIYERLPPKRKKVLNGLVAGDSNKKIMVDADVASQDALYHHFHKLYENFKIDTRLHEVDNKGTGENKQRLLTTRVSSAIPELLNNLSSSIANKCQDWGDAPDVRVFYGRAKERVELNHWILQDKYRMIGLWGLGGIGKTAFVVKVAKDIQNEFEFVIWRSLHNSPTLNLLLVDIVHFLSNQQIKNLHESRDDLISILIQYLTTNRCLVVLDRLEQILQAGDRAGQYCEGYEDYGELFKRVAQKSHKSCLLILSRELPQEIVMFADTKLRVEGLREQAAQEILKDKNLTEYKSWPALISRYSGNPLALNIVSTIIKDLFRGRVSEFLDLNTLYLGDFRPMLDWYFDRLPSREKEIAYWLVIEWEPVSLQQLYEEMLLPPSSSCIIEALNSLERRSLIHKGDRANQSLFALSPVVMDYFKKRLREHLLAEVKQLIMQQQPDCLYFLKHYPFYKSKSHAIMKFVRSGLSKIWQSESLERQLSSILSNLKTESRIAVGYAEENLENLRAEIQPKLDEQ